VSHVIRFASVCSLAVAFAYGCTIPPRPGTPVPPAAELVAPVDPRAVVYGSSIEDVLRSPEVGDKIRAMFGPDWSGGELVPPGASAYTGKGGPPRVVRIGGVDYVAVTGCVPTACDIRRMLILIREGGSEILARLDEGGFSHYYAYGNVSRDAAQLIADSGWRALQRASNPYPSTTS
jgi:hypothetical protein